MEILSLKLLVLSPLIIPALFLLPIFDGHEVIIRRIAKTFAFLHMGYTLCFWLFAGVNTNVISDEILVFGQSWIQTLDIRAILSLDGLSLTMVILSSLITLLAVIASKRHIRFKHKLYYSLIFILQTAILGVFTASDMLLFFFFWELELIPMYFLISLWGSGNSQKSAMKFLLYTFISSLFLLVGILLLSYFNDLNSQTLNTLMANISNLSDKMPIEIQIFVSILLLIGFAVKLPIVPFHTWLPKAHVDAVTPVSMLLASVLLKMGAYGIIRFNVMLLPDAFVKIAPVLTVLAVINIIYAAIVAYAQNDLKRIVAYSSVSNMGIVLLGIASLNSTGLTGGIFHIVSHGFITAGLFMIVGSLYLRTKTRNIKALNGVGSVMSNLMFFAVFFSLAGVGVPLLMGFIGEFMTFLGAIMVQYEDMAYMSIIVICSMLVILLSACYMFKFLHKPFFGECPARFEKIQDLSVHEFFVLMALTILIVFLGIHPNLLIDIIQPFTLDLLESVGL